MPSYRTVLETPLGALFAMESDGQAIIAAAFERRGNATGGRPADPLLREAARQVRAYFRKRLPRFDLPLRLQGSEFEIAIWRFVSQMETGELISYSDLARAIGYPRAHRAAAAAMRKTPIDLVIPAHRVVGADGTVRGAAPGSMRQKLLAFEGIILRSG